MTLLTVCQEVSKVIGLDVPTIVASSTEREYIELFAVAHTMADRIIKGHDWQILSRIHTLIGDGATEDFDLPSDYDRMLVKSQVWSSSLQTPLSPITDLDHWLEIDIKSFQFVVNAWTIYGGQMHIKPALDTAITAKFFYQSDLFAASSGGSAQASFVADSDVFRLSEDLLKLGMIWQWRANKGLPYAEDMMNYEQMLGRLVARDKGSKMMRIGKARLPGDVSVAYPQNVSG